MRLNEHSTVDGSGVTTPADGVGLDDADSIYETEAEQPDAAQEPADHSAPGDRPGGGSVVFSFKIGDNHTDSDIHTLTFPGLPSSVTLAVGAEDVAGAGAGAVTLHSHTSHGTAASAAASAVASIAASLSAFEADVSGIVLTASTGLAHRR